MCYSVTNGLKMFAMYYSLTTQGSRLCYSVTTGHEDTQLRYSEWPLGMRIRIPKCAMVWPWLEGSQLWYSVTTGLQGSQLCYSLTTQGSRLCYSVTTGHEGSQMWYSEWLLGMRMRIPNCAPGLEDSYNWATIWPFRVPSCTTVWPLGSRNITVQPLTLKVPNPTVLQCDHWAHGSQLYITVQPLTLRAPTLLLFDHWSWESPTVSKCNYWP
jgi:hypothetical protein